MAIGIIIKSGIAKTKVTTNAPITRAIVNIHLKI